ncbi:twin-arginine translocation signal domain-containing protein, partial [Bradyrhizobium arachidis]|uniref:twin-arginine translocation signal domain-containing protein n=1 Tax=Bradyrhizobium arachidis TaxID=858423 RepID=UPI0008E2D57A
MADHATIPTESRLASPGPSTAITRRSLLGGTGIAVGAAVLASPPSMPGFAPALAQPASANARPLDEAFKHRAFEVRGVCASNNEKIPIAPHPANGDEARYSNKIGSDSRGLPHDKRGEVTQEAWQALYAACQS